MATAAAEMIFRNDSMQIQFNTDESVDGHEALGVHAKDVVQRALDRFSNEVTRVEIHLSDINAQKVGENDKRCVMEARVAGRQPVAVTAQAGSVHQALEAAAQKLKRSLESTLGKRAEHKGKLPPADTEDDA